MASSPTLEFFKDERDVNVHAEPILPKAHYTLHAEEGVYAIDSVSAVVLDKDGNIKQQIKNEISLNIPHGKPNKIQKSISNKVKYKFDNWTGSEDVLTLCQKCIQELDGAIIDGSLFKSL